MHVGHPAVVQVGLEPAQGIPRGIGAQRFQDQEAVERSLEVPFQFFRETREQHLVHAIRPVPANHEGRVDRHQHESGDPGGAIDRRLQGHQAAHGPTQPGGRWRLVSDLRGDFAQVRAELQVVGRAVTRQVHEVQPPPPGHGIGHPAPDPAVHAPAMEHHQVRPRSADLDYGLARHASSASIRPSTCSGSWADDRVMRNRAVPRGTVGGRIATAR